MKIVRYTNSQLQGQMPPDLQLSEQKIKWSFLSVCHKAVFLFFLITLSSQNIYAQFWKDIGSAIGDVASTGWKITTAPYQAMQKTANVITGNGNVSQIYQPYVDVVHQAGQAVGSTTTAVLNPQQYLYTQAQSYAAQLGGPTEFVFDVSTFTNRYFQSLSSSGGQYLANVMQGRNPLQVNALPLAAAMRAARDRFAAIAKPIPDDVKSALRGKLPDATIDRAKYAVGKLEITLPNLLNFLNVNISNSNNHAVTVDDIIVFAKDPGSYASNFCHWTHEMVHVNQYREWGVEEFAWKFINTHPVEKEANQTASSITGYACNNGTETFLGLAGGSSGNGQPNQPTLINPQTSEYYIAQCFFNNNQYPAYYLITNTSRIVAVNMYNSFQQHIGFAAPPINPAFAWDFVTPNFRYGVATDGNIWSALPQFDMYGRPLLDMYGRQIMRDQIIGYVMRYR